MTRILFALLVLCVVGVFMQSQGWMGRAPSDEGRDPLKTTQEIQPEAVQILPLPATPGR